MCSQRKQWSVIVPVPGSINVSISRAQVQAWQKSCSSAAPYISYDTEFYPPEYYERLSRYLDTQMAPLLAADETAPGAMVRAAKHILSQQQQTEVDDLC